MSKSQFKLSLVTVAMLEIAAAFFTFGVQAGQDVSPEHFAARARDSFQTCKTNQYFNAVLMATPKPEVTTIFSAPPPENPGVLNSRRQYALSMIETGINDDAIGGAGEVSRYQIMPAVWKHYSRSERYHDPEASFEVARQHWSSLYGWFKQQAHREPTDFDMYVLWNTRYGYYASRGFKPAHLDPVVRDRAQRFVNLVKRGES